MTIEAQIRELLDDYAESRILIRRLIEEGNMPDESGYLRLAGAVVYITDACVFEIMAAMALAVAEERAAADTAEMFQHWRT